MNCTLFRTVHRGIGQLSRIGCSQWMVENTKRNMHFLINNQSSISLSNLVGAMKKTLLPVSPSFYNQLCGMKMKGRLERRCKDCYFVTRQERLYVMCKKHPRHKQMAIKPHEKTKRILTVAMQSPKRPW